MKRVAAHSIFWLSYLVLRTSIEYEWARFEFKGFEQHQLFWASLFSCCFLIFPEIIFAYYLTYIGLPKLVTEKKYRIFSIVEILLVLFGCIYAVRFLVVHIVAPIAYRNQMEISPVLTYGRMLYLLFYMGFASGLLLSIESVKKQFDAAVREKNLQREKMSTELKMLRNQINPHFLFNTLNNIYALTRKKSDKAPAVVLKLSELLSFMLYKSSAQFVSVSEELQLLQDYIDLEQIRYNDRLAVQFTKEIDRQDAPVVPLLLLPLVENAFKHGISESRFDGFINIFLSVKGSQLVFVIENSIEQTCAVEDSKRIGLASTRRQLELIYREHTLVIEKELASFKVILTINLNSYGEI
jgi:two-component system, LytTR family, sensor kinase